MQMNHMYQQAVDGTLCSTDSAPTGPLTFTNETCVTLDLYLLSTGGEHFSARFPPDQYTAEDTVSVAVGQSYTVGSPGSEWYWLFANHDTGAFAAVCQTPASGSVTVTSYDLLDANDIGRPPHPTGSLLIPPDSPRIMVGCGTLGNGNIVVREQYWQHLPDSYSIGPLESKTVSSTVTCGMQQTTSDLIAVEASVSGSASGGWGPVSASVSASLSAAATSFQQFTTTSQTTSYVSDHYVNASDKYSRMYLYWQLTDSVTVYGADGAVLSSIVTGTQPVVIGGPYPKPPTGSLL
ncbi:hypothetical protein [Streptomyces exfoliatus]|uniref:hypothetical protein n=1 Tax=Streptomyces exfoliatus TaxID=1905 RepID=UPI00046449BA|nr:hypothetical protein [Streptomyces exfoliatus]